MTTRPNYARGLLEYSEPKCIHFRSCGGCKFQDVNYSEQLLQKQLSIGQLFEQPIAPILGSEPHWRYRNKMEFSFSQSRKNEKFLGLMRKRGKVENLEECFLTNSWFIETLKNVRTWWEGNQLMAYHPPTNRGHLRTLTLREGIRTGEKMAVLTVSEEPIASALLDDLLEILSNIHTVILRRQIIKKKIATHFEEVILKGSGSIHEILYDTDGKAYLFQIKAASFFQPNTFQAEKIYQTVMRLASLSKDESLLDLFCGIGTIGIFASRYAKNILGIELVEEAVADAKTNCVLNNIQNMQIVSGDVAEQLRTLSFHPNTVIVDPPRAGLGQKIIEQLLKIQPERIIYVSCNPVTQAVDCKNLDYKIISLQPIDQFPHTPHVENVGLLEKLGP